MIVSPLVRPIAEDLPRLAILLFGGQSNAVGATGDGDAIGALTTAPPEPGRLLMFNGGVTPLQGAPSAVSKTLPLSPAQYGAIVPAYEGANPLVNRETWTTSAGRIVASALPERDKVLLVNTGLGSCDFNDLVQGFAGSRATFSGSISGTTMTVTAVTITAGTGLTNGLILTGAGITPGTVITDAPEGNNGGPGTYTVSPSQTAGPFTGATTADPSPQPWANTETLVNAAVAFARARGMRPVILSYFFNQGEADQTLVAVANRTAQLTTLRSKVDALKTLTGQSEDILIVHPAVGAPIYDINHMPASNFNNNSPDASLMQTVSAATLAADFAARTLANFATFAQYAQSAGPTGSPTDRVHYDRAGHQEMGFHAGYVVRDRLRGVSTLHPHVVSCTGNLGSTTRTVTLSEDCVIDSAVVSDPGTRGVRYFDDTGERTISTVSVSGTVLTLTFATAPSGVSERVDIACSNGTVTGTYTGSTWPFTAPPVCLGPNFGQRSQIRATRTAGTNLITSAAIGRYLLHQRRTGIISSSSSTVAGAFTDLGVTPSLVLDFADTACYSGTGQTITDRSPSAFAWQRGIDAASDSTDPTFVAASAPEPAYFLFNGTASITPSGTVTMADNWHQSGAAFCFFAAFFLPSAPPYGQAQYLLSTSADATAGIGIQARVSTAGRWGLTVRNGSGVVFNTNSSDVLQAGWNVCAMGINAGTGAGWYMTTPSMVNGTVQNVSVTYTSPSASAKSNAASPFVGKSAVTLDSNSQRFIDQGRIHAVAACGYQTAAKMTPLYVYLAQRVGLTINF